MISNLTDKHFEIIGNMPTIPYIPDPYFAPNPNTSLNFDNYTDNPHNIIFLDLEKYVIKKKYNAELRIRQNRIFDPNFELYSHTWNYDESIVTPYEYTLITKIDIPSISKKKISPIFQNPYDSDVAFLMCNEKFTSSDLTPTSQPLQQLNQERHIPRRLRIFTYAFKAFSNSENVISKRSPTQKKSSKMSPTTSSNTSLKMITLRQKIEKKSHKKKSHKKID